MLKSRLSSWLAAVAALACAFNLAAADNAAKPPPKKKAPRDPNEGKAIGANKATPAEDIKVLKDFKVELLYSVPAETQGSWINLCTDPKGRLIVSDQYGGLYRITPPPVGQPLDPATIEKVPAPIGAANGLLWAFDSLYVVVNDYEDPKKSGVFRVRDSKGNDQLDSVEKLHEFSGRGDHAAHAVLLSPDGKSLFIITGDGMKPVESQKSRVPLHWGEDHLLPRMPDGRGFMRDVLAPGGIIYQMSPDGKEWEIYSSGYRNIFDAAFNRDGELFTYDSDMEYDMNTPWYRPTRVCLAISGSEFGWRNGAGKWPEYYPDSVPPVLNVGPGSPTGMTFGYGAKFPTKYQEALYGCDWSWGKLYAFHFKPNGSGYTGVKEEFLGAQPLPLTDIVVNPKDGALYFTIGGRKVQSGLYRITYVGHESTAPAPKQDDAGASARALRHKLEAFHGVQDPKAVKTAWPYLGDKDRFIRWAARVAIEHQPVSQWQKKALAEKEPAKQLEALLALVRVTSIDPFHRKPTDAPVDKALQAKILEALLRIDWNKLNEEQQITLLRDYALSFVRQGAPEEELAKRVIAQLDPHFPALTRPLNADLCQVLVFLQSPTIAAKAMHLLAEAPTQEEQMEYAKSLRMLKAGWSMPQREDYFKWFLKAANYRGGASFEKFIEFIHNDAVANLPEDAKLALKPILDQKPEKKSPLQALSEALAGRTFVKEWKLDEIAAVAEKGLKNRDYERGRKMFGAVGCFACHRFANEGGMVGPDLSGAGGRYTPRDFLDQIVNPSKEINEQFAPIVVTTTDGEQVTGRIVNLNGDTVSVNTDLFEPNQQVRIDRKLVKSMEPSKISPMPEGLLNVLNPDEIMDLVAYVLSGGNRENRMFAKP